MSRLKSCTKQIDLQSICYKFNPFKTDKTVSENVKNYHFYMLFRQSRHHGPLCLESHEWEFLPLPNAWVCPLKHAMEKICKMKGKQNVWQSSQANERCGQTESWRCWWSEVQGENLGHVTPRRRSRWDVQWRAPAAREIRICRVGTQEISSPTRR